GDAAAELGAGEAEGVAQHPQERRVGGDADRFAFAVDGEADRGHERGPHKGMLKNVHQWTRRWKGDEVAVAVVLVSDVSKVKRPCGAPRSAPACCRRASRTVASPFIYTGTGPAGPLDDSRRGGSFLPRRGEPKRPSSRRVRRRVEAFRSVPSGSVAFINRGGLSMRSIFSRWRFPATIVALGLLASVVPAARVVAQQTGTKTPRTKLETSNATTVLSAADLVQAAPRSTTEMLRYIPGFTRVESSGGEVNENIGMRGILGVEYVMFLEDGLPVFPTMHTYFMNADNLFRIDDNVERVEVVRGAGSALFGSNTPGAIVNLINHTGGPEVRGTMTAYGGTGSLARYNFNVNGPI